MKTRNMLFAAALALSTVMAPAASALNSVPVFAADEEVTQTTSGTLVIPKAEKDAVIRSYSIYQIFTGSYASSNSGETLSELKWGENAPGSEGKKVGDVVSKADIDTLLGKSEHKDVADTVAGNYVDFKSTPFRTVTASTDKEMEVELPNGYYLIRETTEMSGEADAVSLDVIQIIGGEYTLESKTSVPHLEKKVQDTNDTTGETTGWQDSADYDYEDTIPFQLKAVLGDKYDTYDHYKLVFNDEYDTKALSAPTNIVVKAGEKTLTENTDYFVTNTGNGTFTVTINDLKKAAPDIPSGGVVTVEYSATLLETAALGKAEDDTGTKLNKNTSWLTFTNNPTWDGKGESPNGETPKDTVRVFTYKLDVNKKAEDGKTDLTGATFKLSKKVKNKDGVEDEWKVVDTITGTEKSKFTFSGLDDGTYKLEETEAPKGYNAISPIEFVITATHDESSDLPELQTLNFGNLKATITEDTNGTVDITNTKNANLPETGGMGTTVLYGAGALLTAGAAILFVTNKRMKKEGE